MKVLNIHGYHGSARNSAARALETAGYEVVSFEIDYDKELPVHIFSRLSEEFKRNGCDAICGTSLGGFFATILCAEFDVPTLLINPALLPEIVLPTLGYKDVLGINEFRHLNLKWMPELDLRYVSTVVGSEDETITTLVHTEAVLGNSRFLVIDGGRHSGSTLGLEELLKKHGKEWFNDLLEKSAYFT